MSKKASLETRVDKKLNKWAARITAAGVIIGAATGICSFVTNQFSSVISGQIDNLRQELQAADNKQEQQITRLELLNMIYNQPENTAAIEKIAKHYFQELNGDWYATGVYSEWCAKYGGDSSVAAGVK